MNIFQKITITPIVAIFLQVSALSKNALSAELLQKPLITGASVSADWGTLSPGNSISKSKLTLSASPCRIILYCLWPAFASFLI
jgi:hypothetical protein